MSVDADRGPLDKETGYLIEEIVKLEDTQAALLLLRNVHNTTPAFSLRTSSPTANSQYVSDICNKTFNSLAAILNCKVGQLSEKEILARIHLPTGPGLGFVDLRKGSRACLLCSLVASSSQALTVQGWTIPLTQYPEPHGTYQELATKALANKDLIESDLLSTFNTSLLGRSSQKSPRRSLSP